MIILYSALFGITVAGMTLFLLLGLRGRSEVAVLDQERVMSVSRSLTLEDVELSMPFRERVLAPTMRKVLGFLGRRMPAQNLAEMRHLLEVAGRPYGWAVLHFVGLRVLAGLVCALLAFLVTQLGDLPLIRRLILVVASGGLGYYLPLFWLRSRIKNRKREILRALPDGIEMLNVCVGAGLGFDMALSRVGEQWQNPLSDEFNRVVLEMRLGKTRRQALLDLAHRTDVMELENFAATIIQADQLGVSIAKVLRTQAEQMRIARRQKAEELARQAAIKLLFPLVFLIFPAMFAVLLGPAVPQVMGTLGSLGR
ncbi:MAG TPA: type II secretion system F family protein [Anaerolineae bacterium]|nr:type II secretion system F family protein [Anaerolineae bacterium]